MHRKVDRASAANSRARVVPLAAGGQDLIVAPLGVDVPAARALILSRNESGVGFDHRRDRLDGNLDLKLA